MVKKYVNEDNLQIAMTEYNNLGKGDAVITQYDDIVGRVTLDFDNENGNGEQVYAVVKDPNLPKDHVLEVTVLFRGSTGPNEVLSKPADVWNDWVENDLFLGLRVFIYKHRLYAIL
ncbi:hypothetical protein NKE48_06195 [Streptococcus suis]|uniref:hypothetical protein n=2 Tax=Streptococcus suis TaxID=1307 RepID=UPI001EF7F76B|nr:hypothetical protein [Streptococcus suis]MCO8173118.1 hypothetical protein [Streptococcus suis]MCO8181512.1 hypothetical protein [Streptococcus suis]MCO8192175.1 hypothetical protein [Streptococcus suis]MCO8203080.1 hypothetical protein [Streptococcus suis]MCO8222735.1 hypothetical protein [Streptococcus suis]